MNGAAMTVPAVAHLGHDHGRAAAPFAESPLGKPDGKEILYQQNSALYAAAGRGDAATVSQLLADGADPNAVDPKFQQTPLWVAVYNGHARAAQELLQASADPNMKTIGGNTPLITAVTVRKRDCVQVLLDHKADPNLTNSYHNADWAQTYGMASRRLHPFTPRSTGELSALEVAQQKKYWDIADLLEPVTTLPRKPVLEAELKACDVLSEFR